MSRKLIIPIVLLVLLLLLLFPSIAKADGIVTFPDANLEAVVRQAIQKPTGAIHQSDLKNITKLTASYSTGLGWHLDNNSNNYSCSLLQAHATYQKEKAAIAGDGES